MKYSNGRKIKCFNTFWDGKNPGTKSMIDIAKNKGIKVAIVRIDNANIKANKEKILK